MKEQTVNIRKTIIRILAVLLVLFGIWNAVWLFYLQLRFVRVANQADLEKQEGEKLCYLGEMPLESSGTARYGVFCPPYLRFSHNYTVSEEPDIVHVEQDGKWLWACDYSIHLIVRPSLFGKPQYQLTIYDQKTANEQYLANETQMLGSGDIYTFDVDENMEIVREWTYGGRAVYDAAYEQAYAMFTRAKEVFGL